MTNEQSQLIEQHLALVGHIVAKQCLEFPAHVDREELVRAGMLGLVEAARRYDSSRGMPFARFAGFRIRGAVVDALRTNDWAPRSVRRSARVLEVSRAKLTADLGRKPSVEELALDLGSTPARVADLETDIRRGSVLSLDRALTDEDGSVSDGPADFNDIDVHDMLEDRELCAYLRDAVRLLPERHRLVIIGYFFEGKTSGELARLLAVSESRVSQLRSEAFTMLRDGIESQYAPPADESPVPRGRVARRQADYAEAVATSRDWRERLAREDRVLTTV